MNISKQMSYLLRHKPEKAGFTVDENGYVPTQELLQHFSISLDELENIVETNDKKRFSFNSDKSKIKANQGHSIQVDLKLPTVVPPIHLYHGTTKDVVELIKKSGIKKMNRHHVHLSDNKDTALKVADRRRSESVILTIDARKMFINKVIFYRSENGVYLTDFVDPKYILI